MYVAVKGGEKAIAKAHELLKEKRRGDPGIPDLTIEQIQGQLTLAVDRVMAEGSLYDRQLAALAVKQAWGDQVEAAFLLRAYRTTLPRFGYSSPLDTGRMSIRRRISAIYKDLPGGQVLGPTYDYTHRLLDFSLPMSDAKPAGEPPFEIPPRQEEEMPRVVDFLGKESLIQVEKPEENGKKAGDLTREPLRIPAKRDIRLQNLARGDEGFLLGMAYSTQRGFGKGHPFVGEIRMGEVEVEFVPEELGFPVVIGDLTLTECLMINLFTRSGEAEPMFTQGYGLTFGQGERKAMAMAVVDRALRAKEMGEGIDSPAQDEEFVLYHSDNVEASGFLQHLKLPHHVDFQAELTMLRDMQRKIKEKEMDGGGYEEEGREKSSREVQTSRIERL